MKEFALSNVQGDSSPQNKPAQKLQGEPVGHAPVSGSHQLAAVIAVLLVIVIVVIVLWLSGAINTLPSVLAALGGALAAALGGIAAIIAATGRRSDGNGPPVP